MNLIHSHDIFNSLHAYTLDRLRGWYALWQTKKLRIKIIRISAGFFSLGLFGHSESKILHCAGPHPL